MRRALIWVGRTALGSPIAFLVQDYYGGLEIGDLGTYAMLGLSTAGGALLIGTTDPVRNLFGGPKLASGEISEETRDAIGGKGLQVLRVAIYNARDSGGEKATARDVVPYLEAFDAAGKQVAHTRGSWGFDVHGVAPPTVTFRPTREEHPLELAAKFPDAETAWLAGAVEPRLGRGLYTIRASLRGDGLGKPATFEWRLVNPGKGGELALTAPNGDWPELPPPTATDEPPVASAAAEADPAPRPQAPPVAPPSAEAEPPTKPFNAAVGELVMEGRQLMEDLLAARRQKSANPLGIIPAVSTVAGRTRSWNERVAQVVDDSHLPFREKIELEIYRDSPFLIGGPSAEKLAALIENNMSALGRLR